MTNQYQVSFAVSPSGGGTTSPSGTNVWENAGSLSISATPSTNYHFSSWSATTGITITSPTSSSTTATISGTGTITANFGLNPAIDNPTTGSGTSGNSFTIALTTTKTNDLIYVSVISYGRYVSSISGTGGLTLTCRQSAGNTISWTYNYQTYYLSTWYVVWTSSGSTTLTVTMSGAYGTYSAAAVAYGISNVNTASPFDGAYASNTGSGSPASTSKSTTNPNDMIIGAVGVSSGSSSVPSLTAGLSNTINTATQNTGNYRVETSDEYQILTATQTNFAVGYTWTGTYSWGIVADAVQPAQ
jgi:hypothetical protein